jgi:hypothetical protein
MVSASHPEWHRSETWAAVERTRSKLRYIYHETRYMLVRCYGVNIIKHNIFYILMCFIIATHEHIPSWILMW